MFFEKDGLGQREESDFRVAISDLIRLLSRGLGNSKKQSQENASALTRSDSGCKIDMKLFKNTSGINLEIYDNLNEKTRRLNQMKINFYLISQKWKNFK